MKKRVLCLTDLTSRSASAVQRAAWFAKQLDAQVTFLHTIDTACSERVIRMKSNRARSLLITQALDAMPDDPQVQISVRRGTVLEGVADTVREWNPDLIVMATPRRRALDVLLGTTVERVSRISHCPVLITGKTLAGPYQSILLATDLSTMSPHVAGAVAQLGLSEHALTSVVHGFVPPYWHHIQSEAPTPQAISDRHDHWHSIKNREVLQDLKHSGLDLARVRICTELAQPIDAIHRALVRIRPDLFVIGVSRWIAIKRLLIGSVADHVFRNIDCDVLAIWQPNRSSHLNAQIEARLAATF